MYHNVYCGCAANTLQVYRELFILRIILLRKQTPTLVITQSATQNRIVSSTVNLSRSLKLRVKKNLNDILTSLEPLPTAVAVGGVVEDTCVHIIIIILYNTKACSRGQQLHMMSLSTGNPTLGQVGG